MKLSIIIPFVAEYPQVLFTILNLWFELKNSDIDYEIIAIDNWCEQSAEQVMWTEKCQCGKSTQFKRRNFWGKQFKTKDSDNNQIPHENVCGDRVKSYAAKHKWLTYLHYDKKLSHWQAKNLGVANSTGDVLFFIDSHCMVPPGSLVDMFRQYTCPTTVDDYHGTLHMPVTYFLENDGVALDYKLVANADICEYHYSFTRHQPLPAPYKIPCMSTCGMMMFRSIYDDLGGWPEQLGIYGGGENFINFTLATLGYNIWVSNVPALHHYAEKRGYNYEYTDYKRNQIIATYMFGGELRAETFSKNCKLDEITRSRILQSVLNQGYSQRQMLLSKQVISIDGWLKAEPWK